MGRSAGNPPMINPSLGNSQASACWYRGRLLPGTAAAVFSLWGRCGLLCKQDAVSAQRRVFPPPLPPFPSLPSLSRGPGAFSLSHRFWLNRKEQGVRSRISRVGKGPRRSCSPSSCPIGRRFPPPYDSEPVSVLSPLGHPSHSTLWLAYN